MDAALEALPAARIEDPDSVMSKVGLREGIDAAWAVGDRDRMRAFIEAITPRAVRTSPVLSAIEGLGGTRLGILTDTDPDETDRGFAAVTSSFRGCGARFWLTTLVEWAEWIRDLDRPDDTSVMLVEAREVFEGAGALVWLARLGDPIG